MKKSLFYSFIFLSSILLGYAKNNQESFNSKFIETSIEESHYHAKAYKEIFKTGLDTALCKNKIDSIKTQIDNLNSKKNLSESEKFDKKNLEWFLQKIIPWPGYQKWELMELERAKESLKRLKIEKETFHYKSS
jgi:D-mannonate dehydratase